MYDLIAFDMDGTLLAPDKSITPGVLAAIEKASDCGKTVAVSTGRSMDELSPYDNEFRKIRYAICESGGVLYDRFEKRSLVRICIPGQYLPEILAISQEEDIMIQCMANGINYIPEYGFRRLADFGMEVYREQYAKFSTLVPDTRDLIRRCIAGDPSVDGFEKINIYHTSTEARERTFARLQHLPLDMCYSEQTSVELSPPGVNKGACLKTLCEHLGIPITRAIAVGDNDNDRPMLETAGLSIAMGNAVPDIQSMCGAVVADNEHDGAAEAIYKYLL